MTYVLRSPAKRAAAAAIDAAGRAFFRRASGPFTGDVRSVLIVRLDHLGDVLLSLGLPKAVKEGFRGCRVLFLTSSWAAPLLENNPFVDETIVYDAPWFAAGRYRRARGPGFLALARRLRSRRIDVALAPRGDARENALLALAGVRERVGYGVTGGGFLLTREVAWRAGAHETRHLTAVLETLGIRSGYPPPKLYLTDAERAQAAALAASAGLAEGRDVGFHADAGTPAKMWPHASAFVARFAERFPGRRLAVVGAPGGPPFEGAHVTDLRGRTTLRALCALLPRLGAFLGADSGPAHLASAVGVPTVFLYSGTNSFERWRPLAEHARALRREVACAPCHRKRCPVPGHPCLSGIAPEEALEALAGAGIA